MEAFELAVRLGATGLESDVWTTADGIPVLDHDGAIKRGLRRTRIGDVRRDQLPEHIPTLDELLTGCGQGLPLSLDVKDGEFDAVAEVIARHDHGALSWLCHPGFDTLSERRDALSGIRLVHSTRLAKLDVTPEQHASRLATTGIDAMNMHHTDWNGGLVVLFHKFDVYTFGWDLQFEHQLAPAVRMGLDAIYSDHTDLMVDVVAREAGTA